jgi:hypothetical protein
MILVFGPAMLLCMNGAKMKSRHKKIGRCSMRSLLLGLILSLGFTQMSAAQVTSNSPDMFSSSNFKSFADAFGDENHDQTACVERLVRQLLAKTPLADYKVTWIGKPLGDRSVKNHEFKFDLWKGKTKVSGTITATTEYVKSRAEPEPRGGWGQHQSPSRIPAHWKCRYEPSSLPSNEKTFSLSYVSYGTSEQRTNERESSGGTQ